MITLDEAKELIPDRLKLVYIDYRDSLDNNLDGIQEAVRKGELWPIYESIDDWWIDCQYDGYGYILDELKDELESGHEDEDIDKFLEEFDEEIREVIFDRDMSNPVKDLLRNTRDIVAFYDTGVEIPSDSWQWDDEEFAEQMAVVKDTLQIATNEYDKDLWLMLAQAAYGGQLVIYFNLDVDDWMKEGDAVHFKNPMVAVIDTYGGSGDHTNLPKHELTLALNRENIFVDKLIKYSYTYSVCGMYDTWCSCTEAEIITQEAPETHSSPINVIVERDNQYAKVFKDGRCTPGDMDINRHRNVYYRNDFPCGHKCPDCGTFWID